MSFLFLLTASQQTLQYVDPMNVNYGRTAPSSFLYKRLEKDILPNQEETVLEIGPGLNPIFNHISISGQYQAVEPSSNALAKIIRFPSENPHLKYKFFEGSLQQFYQLKSLNNSYSTIVCAHVLHFFDPVDFMNALNQFYDSLKYNGKLYLTVNSDKAQEQQINHALKQGDLWGGFCADGTITDLHCHQSHASMEQLLTAIGFNSVTSSDHTQDKKMSRDFLALFAQHSTQRKN